MSGNYNDYSGTRVMIELRTLMDRDSDCYVHPVQETTWADQYRYDENRYWLTATSMTHCCTVSWYHTPRSRTARHLDQSARAVTSLQTRIDRSVVCDLKRLTHISSVSMDLVSRITKRLGDCYRLPIVSTSENFVHEPTASVLSVILPTDNWW